MKKLLSAAVSAFMILCMLAVPSCSASDRKVELPPENTEKVTIPEKNCKIEFPEKKPYDYQMELTLDTESQTVGGHVIFEFYNDSTDTWNELCLRDYASLFDKADVYESKIKRGGGITEISNVRDSRGGSLEVERDKDDVSVIWLKLKKALEPGSVMKLTYDFVTKIPNNADRFGFANNIYNVTNFYPILAEYADGKWSHTKYFTAGECFYSEVSNYHVRLEVPSGFKVASTGEQILQNEKDGKITYKLEAPYVRDFVFCASGDFAKEQSKIEGVIVNVFYNKVNPANTDMKDPVRVVFETAETSFKAFGEAFGKYPYPELDIVIAPDAAGGMEFPNLVLISENLCQPYIMQFTEYDQLEICLLHEIAHQWFMGIVGSNSGEEPWLDESMASYAELVFYEYVGGEKEKEHLYGFGKKQRNLVEKWGNNDKLDVPFSAFSSDMEYTSVIYVDGKAALYQMEEILGREMFHGIIRGYVKRNAFRNATTKDFLKALYDCAGTDNEELNKLTDKIFRTKI